MHQLNPQLKKDKWSKKENKQLFNLFYEIGCKWKEIAEYFVVLEQVSDQLTTLLKKLRVK